MLPKNLNLTFRYFEFLKNLKPKRKNLYYGRSLAVVMLMLYVLLE